MKIKDLENKIINADCYDILKQLPDHCVDLVLTDPPYELETCGGVGKSGLGARAKAVKDNILFISNGFDYKTLFNEFKRICKPLNLYIFCSNKQISKTMSFFENEYPTTLLTWHKTNAIPLVNKTYHSNVEYIVCVRDKGSTFNQLSVAELSKVISMPYPVGDRIHPTQKPVLLLEKLLKIKTKENDLVLDCFSGSGSTAIACHKTNRRFICIEKNKDFYDSSCKRLMQEQSQAELFKNQLDLTDIC